MERSRILSAFTEIGKILNSLLEGHGEKGFREDYSRTIAEAEIKNPWFNAGQLVTAFKGVIKLLDEDKLKTWSGNYPYPAPASKKVGVIMAGNIPMAGFHDFLCVLMSGHILHAKLSSADPVLLPFVARVLISVEPKLEEKIVFTDRLNDAEAVIATGSNNTSRYFEYYFGKLPHIFRRNRNSVGILTGKENEFDLRLLGRDIFSYYGLGCRNISKVYVPEGYNFSELFENLMDYSGVNQHTRYMNNYDYHQAVYLLNSEKFLTNNFLIIKEDTGLSSPVAVLFYETYSNREDLGLKLNAQEENIQCIVSKSGNIPFGQAQFPEVTDYADRVDTMEFLTQKISQKSLIK